MVWELEEKSFNLWLMVGTWVMVAISLFSTCSTQSKMADQLKESRSSAESQWRPKLVIIGEVYDFDGWYWAGEEDDLSNLVRLEINEVKIGSREWPTVKRFSFITPRKLWLRNLGTSPLRITNRAYSAISETEWKGQYHKSSELLLERIIPELIPPETETVILPGDSLELDLLATRRQMLMSVFEEHVNKESIIIYPYTYIEYENVFEDSNTKYNVILMRHMIVGLEFKGSIVSFSDSATVGNEIYQWDVGTK